MGKACPSDIFTHKHFICDIMKWTSAGKTDVGLRRAQNEDTFLIEDDLQFCLVADGMGGEFAGDLASRIFSDTALKFFSRLQGRSENEISATIKKVFHQANEKILAHAGRNAKSKIMGCTAELLALSDTGFVLGHVGDSRSYCRRKGKLIQLTHDHSLVQRMIDNNEISREKAANHPRKNVVLRAVGADDKLSLDLITGKIAGEDLFLLCTDGLSNLVPDERIGEILSTKSDLHQKADILVEQAKSAGGHDNITVVLSKILN